MDALQPWLMLIARTGVAALYFLSGWRQSKNRANVIKEMTAHGIPMPGPVLAAAITLQIVGSIAIAFGIWARLAALALFAFTAIASWIYYRDLSDREHFLHLIKNLAILGGLLMIIAVGPGGIAITPR